MMAELPRAALDEAYILQATITTIVILKTKGMASMAGPRDEQTEEKNLYSNRNVGQEISVFAFLKTLTETNTYLRA
jgi:hypothetical protein